MSDVVDVESGTPTGSGGTTEGEKTNYTKEDFDKLNAKIKLLMDETKSKSSKLKKFEDEKAKIEEDKLKEEGKFKDLLEKEKNKNLNLAKSLKTKVMDSQLKDAARKAGCPEEKWQALKMLTVDYGNHVYFDDEFQADMESMTSYINKIKEDYKSLNLFEVEKKAPQDGGVGGEPKQEPKNYMTQGLEALEQMGG